MLSMVEVAPYLRNILAPALRVTTSNAQLPLRPADLLDKGRLVQATMYKYLTACYYVCMCILCVHACHIAGRGAQPQFDVSQEAPKGCGPSSLSASNVPLLEQYPSSDFGSNACVHPSWSVLAIRPKAPQAQLPG